MQATHNPTMREMDDSAGRVDALMREVLGSNHGQLWITDLKLEEAFEKQSANVLANLAWQVADETKKFAVKGAGVGLVDALFDAQISTFAKEFVSLKSVNIVDFTISIKLRDTDGRKTDAFAIATLRVKNAANDAYTFVHRTSSISHSTANVVADVMSFFINSERAYTQLYHALADAKTRARPDLIERYQQQMATLVRATSYQDVVARLQTS